MNIEAPITIVPKGWGHEEIYWNETFCGKKLVIEAGKKCSFHHHQKDEVFLLLSGHIKLYYGDSDDIQQANTRDMLPGDTFHVYPRLRHRFEAYMNSEIIEFSTHHEDSDTVRVLQGD